MKVLLSPLLPPHLIFHSLLFSSSSHFFVIVKVQKQCLKVHPKCVLGYLAASTLRSGDLQCFLNETLLFRYLISFVKLCSFIMTKCTNSLTPISLLFILIFCINSHSWLNSYRVFEIYILLEALKFEVT
jgi:hypothetical protein